MKGGRAPPKEFKEMPFWPTLLWYWATGGDNTGFASGRLASHTNIAYNIVHENTERIVRQEIIAVDDRARPASDTVGEGEKQKMRLSTTRPR